MERELIMCNSSYVPTSEQYYEALGSYATSMLIIGSLITFGLFILFFEQCFYTNETAHHGAKRHIYWIASVFPMMTLLSLMALVIPRAHNICLSVKMVYMCIGISHFADLTMVMFGGEEMMVERARDDTFILSVNPLCCCCRCLPRPPVTKYALRLVLLLTDQLPFVQAIYYITVMILLSADNIILGNVEPTGAFLWLNILKLASAMFGIYGFMILSKFSRAHLNEFTYWKKSRSIRLLLLITSFQSMIFSIMGNYGVFPCLAPYVSSSVYRQTVDNSLYLLEMMVLGPYTYWQYHDLMFSTPITALPLHRHRSHTNSTTNSTKNSVTGTVSTTFTASTENSDISDDEYSKGRKNSNNSNNSTKEANDVVSIENERGEGSSESHILSRTSSKGSRSRSARKNSEVDSAYDSTRGSTRSSIRKERKRNSTRETNVITINNINRREDSASSNRDKTSNSKSKTSILETSQDVSTSNDTRERSVSPSSENTAHTTSPQLAPNLLDRARSLPTNTSKGKNDYESF